MQATLRALDEIERLKERHGALVIHQSGGCCDGSSPICLPAQELPAGPGDTLLGDVGGVPVYIDAEQDERWGHPALVIDLADGAAMGFSLEAVDGVHFVTSAPPQARTVVVGYDASDNARRALDWAIERAGSGGRVVVVDATRPQPDVFARPSVEAMLHDRLLEGHANVDLVFVNRADLDGPRLAGEVVEDVPSDALLAAAMRHDADEIVVGHRDRSHLRSLSGSVSAAMLRNRVRPVVVVVP